MFVTSLHHRNHHFLYLFIFLSLNSLLCFHPTKTTKLIYWVWHMLLLIANYNFLQILRRVEIKCFRKVMIVQVCSICSIHEADPKFCCVNVVISSYCKYRFDSAVAIRAGKNIIPWLSTYNKMFRSRILDGANKIVVTINFSLQRKLI